MTGTLPLSATRQWRIEHKKCKSSKAKVKVCVIRLACRCVPAFIGSIQITVPAHVRELGFDGGEGIFEALANDGAVTA